MYCFVVLLLANKIVIHSIINAYLVTVKELLSSVLWCYWLSIRKSIQPVRN